MLTVYYDDATQSRDFEITAGAAAHVDLQMPHLKQPPIEIIDAKPYGAPPARRRIV